MTALYQGKALKSEPQRPRAAVGRLGRIFRMLGAIAIVVALAHLPWDGLRKRFLVLHEVRVEGLRYLDANDVAAIAGIRSGQDLLSLDFERARQRLLLHPRIEASRVTRIWPRGVRVSVVERTPVLLVHHGLPWEVDSAGVLLEPLAEGVVADVPMLAGASFDGVSSGTRLRVPTVLRGLAWVRAMSATGIQLGGQISEVDVTESRFTGLVMMNGTRVLTPAWPPGTRTLSALRVVLADLEKRGTLASEVDLRFNDQVIVRPAAAKSPEPAPPEHVAMEVAKPAAPGDEKISSGRN